MQLAGPILPPSPDINGYVTIGFNTTVRALQRQAGAVLEANEDELHTGQVQDVFAVLACKDTFPDLLTSLLPQLVVAASTSLSDGHAVRLVALPENSEQELAIAVGLPRVGVIGLRECVPDSVLSSIILEKVAPIDVPWAEQKLQYLPLKTTFQESVRKSAD